MRTTTTRTPAATHGRRAAARSGRGLLRDLAGIAAPGTGRRRRGLSAEQRFERDLAAHGWSVQSLLDEVAGASAVTR